jgi:hypothetical protein
MFEALDLGRGVQRSGAILAIPTLSGLRHHSYNCPPLLIGTLAGVALTQAQSAEISTRLDGLSSLGSVVELRELVPYAGPDRRRRRVLRVRRTALIIRRAWTDRCHQLGGDAMRCDPNAQSAENHKSVMAVTAAQSGSVPYLPPRSQQLEGAYDYRNRHSPDKQASAQVH